MPASEARKTELALAYGRDGHTLLKAVDAAAGSDPDLAFLARLHQVEVLRVVLVPTAAARDHAEPKGTAFSSRQARLPQFVGRFGLDR
jgi:hypothetical protein